MYVSAGGEKKIFSAKKGIRLRFNLLQRFGGKSDMGQATEGKKLLLSIDQKEQISRD